MYGYLGQHVQKEGFCQLNFSKLAKESQTEINAYVLN